MPPSSKCGYERDGENCQNLAFLQCSHCGKPLGIHHFLNRTCFHDLSDERAGPSGVDVDSSDSQSSSDKVLDDDLDDHFDQDLFRNFNRSRGRYIDDRPSNHNCQTVGISYSSTTNTRTFWMASRRTSLVEMHHQIKCSRSIKISHERLDPHMKFFHILVLQAEIYTFYVRVYVELCLTGKVCFFVSILARKTRATGVEVCDHDL